MRGLGGVARSAFAARQAAIQKYRSVTPRRLSAAEKILAAHLKEPEQVLLGACQTDGHRQRDRCTKRAVVVYIMGEKASKCGASRFRRTRRKTI